MRKFLLIISILNLQHTWAVNDSLPAKDKGKLYCMPRIKGMSPNRIISIGWDHEFAQTLKSSDLGSYDKKEDVDYTETTRFSGVSGLRFSAKLPIINKRNIIWMFGINYLHSNYNIKSTAFESGSHKLGINLGSQGLTSSGINTSIYKPLNEKAFIIILAAADLNGDYKFSRMQPLQYLKYSIVGMYGKRPSDYKQWAIGVARSYGAGQSSLLPLLMFNYTAPNNKWGAEIMIPARAWYRRVINKNSLVRLGYELEGASYRLNFLSTPTNNYELRRGELRIKTEYQCKLYKSIWLAAQTGYCTMLNYKVDDLGTGKDFTRNIEGKHNYAMINKLSDFMFFNVSINFVTL